MKVIDETPEKMVEHRDQKFDDNMFRQLQLLFGFLELSERNAYDPTAFVYAFKDIFGEPTNPGLQRDAQEFLNEFFDKLEEKLKNSTQKYLLSDIF